MIFRPKAILPVLILSLGFCAASPGHGQEIKHRREAYGSDRAGLVEALLHALFPNAKVEWDPVLAIREGSGPPKPVDVGNFVATRNSDGSINGVTALEVGTAKADYIEKIKKFQFSDGPVFTTIMVAFRAAAPGGQLEIKKVPLDPYDPLTRVTWFEVKSLPSGSWPVLSLHYDSYVHSPDVLTVLEWDSLLDMATNSFLTRIPVAILTFRKDGEPTQELLSSHRISVNQIEIGSAATKMIEYPCTDPCVVDGRTFLAKWSK